MSDGVSPVLILVELSRPGNIGALCCAMANFGVSDLRVYALTAPGFEAKICTGQTVLPPIYGESGTFPGTTKGYQ